MANEPKLVNRFLFTVRQESGHAVVAINAWPDGYPAEQIVASLPPPFGCVFDVFITRLVGAAMVGLETTNPNMEPHAEAHAVMVALMTPGRFPTDVH